MTSKELTVVTDNFPDPKGDIKINEPGCEPTPLRIIAFLDYHIECAMEIPFQDELGLAGEVMSDEDYQKINNNASFVKPVRPGAAPTLAGTTRARTAVQTRAVGAAPGDNTPTTDDILRHQIAITKHLSDKKEWQAYQVGKTALRNQIMDNVDEEYILDLKNPLTKFKMVDPLQLTNHLRARYGKVEPNEIVAAKKQLGAKWDPSTPIATFFKKFDDTQLLAISANRKMHEYDLVDQAFVVIKQSGLYNISCDDWQAKKSTNWIEFKKFFTIESRKVQNHTSSALGYVEQAQALLEVDDKVEEVRQEMTAKFESMSGRTPFGSLNNISDIAEFRQMQEQVQQLCQTVTGNENRAPPTGTSAQGMFRKVANAEAYDGAGKPCYYCWSHGITRNHLHSSLTCTSKREGHKDDSTFFNQKGGSGRIFLRQASRRP